jgi:hypothetical protein
MWQVFTGCIKEPFEHLPWSDVVDGTHYDRRPNIPFWLLDSSPELVQLIKDCWATNPNHR